MPLYMAQFAYTPQAWAALTKKPENREEIFRGLVQKLGGRLVSLYHCFGEYDIVAIYEAPDETTAAATILAAVSPGHLKASKTTTVMTTEQMMEAMRKAGAQTYRAPGQ